MKNQNNPFYLNNSLITKEELISIIEEIWYNEEKKTGNYFKNF